MAKQAPRQQLHGTANFRWLRQHEDAPLWDHVSRIGQSWRRGFAETQRPFPGGPAFEGLPTVLQELWRWCGCHHGHRDRWHWSKLEMHVSSLLDLLVSLFKGTGARPKYDEWTSSFLHYTVNLSSMISGVSSFLFLHKELLLWELLREIQGLDKPTFGIIAKISFQIIKHGEEDDRRWRIGSIGAVSQTVKDKLSRMVDGHGGVPRFSQFMASNQRWEHLEEGPLSTLWNHQCHSRRSIGGSWCQEDG